MSRNSRSFNLSIQFVKFLIMYEGCKIYWNGMYKRCSILIFCINLLVNTTYHAFIDHAFNRHALTYIWALFLFIFKNNTFTIIITYAQKRRWHHGVLNNWSTYHFRNPNLNCHFICINRPSDNWHYNTCAHTYFFNVQSHI